MGSIFQHIVTRWAADQPGLVALRDIALVAGPQGPVVYGLSGPFPGLQLTGWAMTGADPVATSAQPGGGLVGVTPRIVLAETAGGREMALILGACQTGLAGRWLDGQGSLGGSFQTGSGVDAAPAGLIDVAVATRGEATFVYGLVSQSREPILWQMAETGVLNLRYAGVTTGWGGLDDMVVIGRHMALAGQRDGAPFIDLRTIAPNGIPVAGYSLPAAHNPGLSGQMTLATARMDGTDYLIVGAAGSGTLSLFEVTPTGRLRLTDHLMDDRDSRFAGVTEIAVTRRADADGDRVWIAAAGSDDGVSLFELLPGGRLLHLGAQADTTEISAGGIVAIDLGLDAQGRLVMAVAGQRDGGISLLRHDHGSPGQLLRAGDGAAVLRGGAGADRLIGGAGNDTLIGGPGPDILFDGTGADVLTGGPGGDHFVLSADGQTDRITDFDPAQDRLDLSAWPFLRNLGQLRIDTRADGAEIVYDGLTGTERLILQSASGLSITPDAVRAAIQMGGSRYLSDWAAAIVPAPVREPPPPPPAQELRGTLGSDVLHGTDGPDRIFGLFASDRISGGEGDDLIYGGQGFDTIYGGSGDDTLHGMDGWDRLFGGSGNDLITGNNGNDMLYGDEGDDRLFSGLGVDLLFGGMGDDTLAGDAGPDTLYGEAGDDLLRGNAGADLLFGGISNDTLEGGINHDTLYGGFGDDLIFGGNGADLLFGGDGDDTLYGNAGSDTLDGGPGDNLLHGGIGVDTFIFRGEGGTVRIADLQDDIDTLALDRVLWGGQSHNSVQILSGARMEDGLVVLDFGPMGRLEIGGAGSVAALLDDIALL